MNIYILLSNIPTSACRDGIGECWLGINIARGVALKYGCYVWVKKLVHMSSFLLWLRFSIDKRTMCAMDVFLQLTCIAHAIKELTLQVHQK